MARPRVFQYVKVILAKSGLRPSRFLAFLNGILAFGRWLRHNQTPVILDDKIALYIYLKDEHLGNSAIDYLEFGVWKGATLKHWIGQNTNSASRFFGFDSYEGLPEDWGHFATIHKKGTFNLEGVLPEIGDPRVRLVKGLFQDSLVPFLVSYTPKNRLVIHCDADLYSSTLYTLTKLDEHIIPGTIIIFDEFFTVNHEFRALEDYTRSYNRQYRVLTATSQYAQLAIEILI
ncbi:MAG: TylF/MycF/NovP-related O-methyltransferase [Candidatus Neomarinimicrobiota bacterium]